MRSYDASSARRERSCTSRIFVRSTPHDWFRYARDVAGLSPPVRLQASSKRASPPKTDYATCSARVLRSSSRSPPWSGDTHDPNVRARSSRATSCAILLPFRSVAGRTSSTCATSRACTPPVYSRRRAAGGYSRLARTVPFARIYGLLRGITGRRCRRARLACRRLASASGGRRCPSASCRSGCRSTRRGVARLSRRGRRHCATREALGVTFRRRAGGDRRLPVRWLYDAGHISSREDALRRVLG